MSKKQWSDITILKSIKNPSNKSYEIKIKAKDGIWNQKLIKQ